MWIASSNVAVTCSGCLGTTLPAAGYVDASEACANRAGADVAASAGAAPAPSPAATRNPAVSTAAVSLLSRRVPIRMDTRKPHMSRRLGGNRSLSGGRKPGPFILIRLLTCPLGYRLLVTPSGESSATA